MAPEVFLYIMIGWQPLPCCHPPNFPYWQLPTETICELNFNQCTTDSCQIRKQMQLLGGWQKQQLSEKLLESERLSIIYYYIWWVTWSQSTKDQRDEYTERTIDLIGSEAFWSGNIPSPMSLRRNSYAVCQ